MRLLLGAGLACTLALAAACGDTGDGGEVEVTLSEWSIATDKESLPEGPIEFRIKNDGEEEHQLLIVKTGFAADELPARDDGSLDEDGADIDVKEEIDDIESGDDTGRTYELDAGTYVLVCNLVNEQDGETVAHFANGMSVDFELTEEE
jgi:hypothetical protein